MSAIREVIRKIFGRAFIFALSFVLCSSVIMQTFNISIAHAYGLVTSRSIEMSNSSVNASSVTYTVQFTPSGTTAIGGVVVDFCSNSPIIGDSCNPPTGLSVGSSPSVSGYTNMGSAGNWTATAANVFNTSYYRTLILTNSGTISTSSSTALSFSITSMTNPSAANTTFYARILTFDTASDANSYSPTGSNSGLVDAGGVALSTTNQIIITARVQETLTFCVATSSSPCTCSSSCSNVTLGDNHGVLSTSGPYVDKTTEYTVATNANSGVAIRLKGDTLTSGSNSISALTTAATSSAGTSQFGICTYAISGSSLTAAGSYDGGGSTYCHDTTQTAGTGSPGGAGSSTKWYLNTTNTTSTYGDTIATMGADSANTGDLVMMANIANTQQAGIYTTTFTLIATSTY